jgi:hypothetical protein
MKRTSRRRAPIIAWALCAVVGMATMRSAGACDICAVYTATAQRESRTGLRLGIAEQYSAFGTELRDGREVTLPADEHMDSSVTQFVVGYTFTPRFTLQVNLPYVDRTFTRIRDHRLENGGESGIGDLALIGDLVAYRAVLGQSLLQLSVLGGIKFPTGDASRLAEELVPDTAPVQAAAAPRPALAGTRILPAEGGLHGHDLTLGSGSYDGIAGGRLFWSWRRLFVGAGMQYAIRSPGSFGYQFANDLTWQGGPGVFALLEHGYSLGVQAAIAGETKGKDTQQGMRLDDTSMTALYAGPALSFTWGTSLAADLAVDIPAIQHTTSLQLVPDVRVRGGITWSF